MHSNDRFNICPICYQDLVAKTKKCPHCESSLYQYRPLVVSGSERLERQAAGLKPKSAKLDSEPASNAEVAAAKEVTSFMGLRIARGVFGFFGVWQILTALPSLTGGMNGNLAALIMIKLLAMAIFLGIYWAIGNHINSKHMQRHGAKHPSLNGFFSL